MVHGPFTNLGFKTFCQRWRHWVSSRPSRCSAIFFQLFPLCLITTSLNNWSWVILVREKKKEKKKIKKTQATKQQNNQITSSGVQFPFEALIGFLFPFTLLIPHSPPKKIFQIQQNNSSSRNSCRLFVRCLQDVCELFFRIL